MLYIPTLIRLEIECTLDDELKNYFRQRDKLTKDYFNDIQRWAEWHEKNVAEISSGDHNLTMLSNP
jgi:hypothetical protein